MPATLSANFEANCCWWLTLRLDNRDALAEALSIAPAQLAEAPDSVLLLAAYQRWGEACVDHLIGDFAFAISQASSKHLHPWTRPHDSAAPFLPSWRRVLRLRHGDRRPMGHAGRAAADPANLCLEEALARRWHQRPAGGRRPRIEGLCGGDPSPPSKQRLAAVSQRRYWKPHAAVEHQNRDETYYRLAYRRVLEEAVACRVRRATRPCSLLLSGGFDSTAIAALAAPALAGRKLVTVSSVLANADDASPTAARRWVELCRSDMPHLDVRYVTRLDRGIFSTLPPPDADGAGSVNRYVRRLRCFARPAGAGRQGHHGRPRRRLRA